MRFVLALDQGTTSSRAILFERDGTVARDRAARIPPDLSAARLGRARRHRDLGDAVGRDARGARQGARAAPATSPPSASPTSARRPRLGARDAASPIANAIVWQDRRTAPMCDELRAAGHAPTFAAKTGLVLDAYFSGTKLSGCSTTFRAHARARERGELAFGTVDTWLVWNLTGGARALSPMRQREPHAAVRHPHGRLGRRAAAHRSTSRARCCREVVASSGVCGRRASTACDVPIAGIAGDQQAALFGQACLVAGARQEHVRHRLLPADEHRRQAPSRRATTS